MTIQQLTWLIGAVAACGGGTLTVVVTWLLRRGRDRVEVTRIRSERDQLEGQAQQAHADAAAAITAAATTLLVPLQARVEQLEHVVDQQRTELRELRPLRHEVDMWRAENAHLQAELDGLRAENAKLNAQLRGLRVDLDQRTGQPSAGG